MTQPPGPERVDLVEPDPRALALSRAGAGRVVRARATPLPFRDAAFHLVAMLDVLEHLGAQDEIDRR